jgi:hypothetical protein
MPTVAAFNGINLWPDAERFRNFQIGECGHALVWTNRKGEEIDCGAASLRQGADKQSELHRQAG